MCSERRAGKPSIRLGVGAPSGVKCTSQAYVNSEERPRRGQTCIKYNSAKVKKLLKPYFCRSKIKETMFGDLMGKMEQMQAEMKEKLRAIEVQAEAGGGQVKVTANGAREIVNISIASELLAEGDAEAVEDMVMVAINRALELAAAKETETGQDMMGNLLPGGLGGLFG
ncbi:MAG: YbaB/EbfC family nucleoid-associated protein [Bacteroidetes bacterium]|nr:MAG: YbaB/EbfC family nucleoid-associated protein [Bacteroidota bacterium]